MRSSHASYVWVALDHGMTLGPVDGIRNLPHIVRTLARPPVSAVVLHRGTAALLPADAEVGLVLQTFGMPYVGASGPTDKVAVASVDDALRLSADAIAVELNLNAQHLGTALRTVAAMIDEAARHELPVLAMMTAEAGGPAARSVSSAIRVATELGVDLVKIGLPEEARLGPQTELDLIREAVAMAPPTLFAGGPLDAEFKDGVQLAAELGFSGVCIGRNVFQSVDAASVLSLVDSVFCTTEQA